MERLVHLPGRTVRRSMLPKARDRSFYAQSYGAQVARAPLGPLQGGRVGIW